jgi:isopropylmalate/homocitrate/citramalate synthase
MVHGRDDKVIPVSTSLTLHQWIDDSEVHLFGRCGFGAHTDLEWIAGLASVVKHAKITTLLRPGIGTVHHLKNAYDAGVRVVRVATHCTEADVSRQHIEYAARSAWKPWVS